MMLGISRRQFIHSALLTSISSLTVLRQLALAKPKSSHHKVIILGGGLSGLVSAYYLKKFNITCEVYEARPRLGGRIHTVKAFNNDQMFVELGGEFIDSNNLCLKKLVEELHDVHKLPCTLQKFEDMPFGLEQELYFFNNQIYTMKDALPAFASLVRHINKDRQQLIQNNSIAVPTYNNPHNMQRIDQMSLEEYLQSKAQYTERWLIDLLRCAYVGEYGLDSSEQSALNMLVLLSTKADEFKLFGASDYAFRIEGGNANIINSLAQYLSKKIPFHLKHQLLGIKDHDQYFTLTFSENGKTKEIKAQQIICTIPFSVLRNIDGIGKLKLSPVKQKCIAELGYGANAKFMVGFRERFWQKKHQKFPANAGFIYTSSQQRTIWETSHSQLGKSGILTNYLGGQHGQLIVSNLLNKTLDDLNIVMPGIKNNYDGNKRLHVWTQQPFSKGSYTCAKPGQYTTLFGASAEPELNGRLLFAGEHCSVDFQGFMEGACQSALRAVIKIVNE